MPLEGVCFLGIYNKYQVDVRFRLDLFRFNRNPSVPIMTYIHSGTHYQQYVSCIAVESSMTKTWLIAQRVERSVFLIYTLKSM